MADALSSRVSSSPRTSDSNSYLATLTVEHDDDLIARVTEQLSSWLREKNWDAPLDSSGLLADGGRELLVLHHQSADGHDLRARLREPTNQGTWVTQLTVHAPRKADAWLSLRVNNDEGRWVDVPRLATYLMDSLSTRDGDTSLTSGALLVDPRGIDELMDSICDLERRGLLLVAGTADGIDLGPFRAQVERWTRQVRGLAQVVVLTPSATLDLAAQIGSSHAVRPWTIRTYYPEVDPAVEADGLRHKWLTTRRLAEDSDASIRKLLGRIARRHAGSLTAPPAFTKVDRAFQRLEDKLVLEGLSSKAPAAPAGSDVAHVVHTPPADSVTEQAGSAPQADEAAADGAEHYLATLDLIKAAFALPDLTEEAIHEAARISHQGRISTESIERVTRQLQDRQQRISELEDELTFFKELYEDEQLDAAEAHHEVSRLTDEARWLRGRLAGASDTAAYGLVPSEEFTRYPSDFADLRDRLAELEAAGVVFTGDEKEMLALDEYDTLNKLVRIAWDGMWALADYLRARNEGRCSQGVKQYLTETPQGYRSLPPKKFAERETGTTMDAWGDLREFPVPAEVSPGGIATMEPHFKLGRVGMVSPRMYFLDCASTLGKVYVGYVGAHLRNTQT